MLELELIYMQVDVSMVLKKFRENSLMTLASLKKCPNMGSLWDFMFLIIARMASPALKASATIFSSMMSFLFLNSCRLGALGGSMSKLT